MYTFDGRVRFSETDSAGLLTLPALLNYFQDCSTFHSEDMGTGMGYLKERQLVWVLSAWQIVVERYPRLCEYVKTGTVPYEFKGFLGYRNFVMMTENGECLAKANSLWSLLNTENWKPAAVPEGMREKYVLSQKLDMDYAPRKIAVPQSGKDLEPMVVREHHLDSNHHVNNGQYVSIAMDFLPQNFTVRRMRAEYRKQALLGDVMHPYAVREEDKCIISLNDGEGRAYAVVEFT